MTTVDKRVEYYILHPAIAVDILAGVIVIFYIALLMGMSVGTTTPNISYAASNAIATILQILIISVLFLFGSSTWFILSVIYSLIVKGMISP